MLDHAESLYGTLATLYVAAADTDRVLERLRAGGFFALLDDDADLLRGLAAIGLANTAGYDHAMLSICFGVYGLADDLAERVVASAGERYGMPLVLRPEEGVTVALV